MAIEPMLMRGGSKNIHMSMISLISRISLLFILGTPSLTLSKRVKRVKPGTMYKEHDPVHVVVNKVGPFNNPTETYRYYSLPFCKHHASPDEIQTEVDREDDSEIELARERIRKALADRKGGVRHKQRLGESIVGDRRETSPYELSFMDNVEWRGLCKVHLSKTEVTKLKEAIHNNWFFEMFVEDLPMWGYVGDISGEDLILGELENSKTFLFPHLHFRIGLEANEHSGGRRIVSATLSTDSEKKVDITDPSKSVDVEFTYSVEWYIDPETKWKDRMDRYHDSRFLPNTFEVHWLSIINAIVLVLLLTAFLVIILLRVLKNDFSRYMEIDDQTMEEEESGWKLIHGDVFRFPQYPAVFCAAVGTGVQLIVASLFLFVLALMGVVSTTKRGSVLAAIIVLYCLSSFVGGYWSSRFYRQMGGKLWVQNIVITAILFPLPVFSVFAWVNTIALFHGSTSALPFGAVFTVFALYVFCCFPLTVVGGILAKNYSSADFNAPTRTTKVAREIPTEVPWYRGKPFQLLIAACLPFSAIYIEMHYIFATVWGHQIYTLFGIVFLTFILLIVVTSFITVALLYFQLAREDHRWWWISYINGGATGFCIFLYSFYFYFHSSEMKGMLQGSFYFGYMTVISFAFFLMLGSSAFLCSLWFVRHIYSRIKCD